VPTALADPLRPVQLVMPAATQRTLIVIFGLLAVVAFLVAAWESRARRDLVPLYAVLGAGLAIVYEPLADTLIHCYYPERGQETWVHTFGLGIPAFIGLGYIWYMSVGALVLLPLSRRGISARQWWTGWLGFGVFATVFEIACVRLGDHPWVYYGPQAFRVLEIPILTTFTYVSFVLAIGAGVCALARFLPPSLHWLIIPAVPMLMAASHVATSLPIAIALSGTSDTTIIGAASVGALGLSAALAFVLQKAFAQPWPQPAGAAQAGERSATADAPGLLSGSLGPSS
jgi:hypothetical protein